MTVAITLSNIQSVRNKENELLEYLTDNNFDACILTETWLKDTDEHAVWVNCSSLNTNFYKMITSNRPNRPGGGLSAVHRSSFQSKHWNKESRNHLDTQFGHLKLIACHLPSLLSTDPHIQ